mmetsp:Transcript_23306/g.64665  ORF Transcript_23306/g.64665 Transcript_23306/m.64665 type:complete len:274 (-) Transcript_23306:772-1593(-)
MRELELMGLAVSQELKGLPSFGLDDLGEIVGFVPVGRRTPVFQREFVLPFQLFLSYFVKLVAEDGTRCADPNEEEAQKGLSESGHSRSLWMQSGVRHHRVDQVEVLEPFLLTALPCDLVFSVRETADLSVPENIIFGHSDRCSELPEIFFFKERGRRGVVVSVGVLDHFLEFLHVFGVAGSVVFGIVFVFPYNDVAAVLEANNFSLDPFAVFKVSNRGIDGELGSTDGFGIGRSVVVVTHGIGDGLVEFLEVASRVRVLVGGSIGPADGIGVL